MRISVAQLNYVIGDYDGNKIKIVAAVAQAIKEKADIVVFSELATCGYPPRDFLEFDDFVERAEALVLDLATHHTKDIAIVIGSPRRNPRIEGKDNHNSVYFLADGAIQYIHDKVLLPTYDIFDEYRYFESGTKFGVVEYKGYKIALTVCEDIWNIGYDNPLYTVCPLDKIVPFNPDFILNVSASPFSYYHSEERLDIVKKNTQLYQLPMIYCNGVGAQTEIIFDGGSVIMSPNGNLYDELPYFEEAIKTYELQDIIDNTLHNERPKDNLVEIHDAVLLGIKDYFGKLGFKKAVLGLSGGIDSAVTCAMACRALGAENVLGVLMPSQFSSSHSVEDAKQLAINLGCEYKIIEIKDIYDQYNLKLEPHFEGLPFNVTEENIQARVRGALLMAFSNKFGNILLNTSNKSEMAVGYGTLYGDLAGGLSVLGDVYKTQVYRLAEYINKDEIYIPVNSITKPPSAELRPDQKDSDSLPDYDILDAILMKYIEHQMRADDIISEGYNKDLVYRILKMVNRNEFKRYQTAPVLRVSPKAFGMGRRMPIVAKY